jgi:hypothetical protein
MDTPNCLFCQHVFDIDQLLSDMGSYDTNTDSGAARCRQCNQSIEFRIRSSTLELGYTYFGGAMHFEGLETFHIPGLKYHRAGPSASIEYQGVMYPRPA